MSSHQILILFLIALVLFILPSIGMYFMFRKAKTAGWKALIPVYNTWVMLEIAQAWLVCAKEAERKASGDEEEQDKANGGFV